jgi:predicted MFS family arabinose efflux permease
LAGAFCATTYLPLYVSAGLQGSTGLAAWSVLYFTIGWTIGSNLASRATARWSETAVALSGYLFVVPALALGALAAFADAPYWMTLATQTVAGVGVGIATNAALTLLRAVSNDGVLGRTNAAHQFLRTQGLTYGAALGGALLLTVAVRTLGDIGLVERLLAGEIVTSADPAAAVRNGFSFTVAAGAVLAALGLLPILALRRHLTPARALRRPR